MQAPWGAWQWAGPRSEGPPNLVQVSLCCSAASTAQLLPAPSDSLGTPILVPAGILRLGQARRGPLASRRRRETTGRWGTDGQSMKLAQAEPRHPRAAGGPLALPRNRARKEKGQAGNGGNGHKDEDKDRDENGNWDRKRNGNGDSTGDGNEDRNCDEDRKRDRAGNEDRDRDENGDRKRDRNENGNRYRDENGGWRRR